MKKNTNNSIIKMSHRSNIFIVLIILSLFAMPACNPDKENKGFTLRIRVREDVDCLHPIVSQSALASQIEELIMLPMIEYSMDKIELSPVMTTGIPQITSTNDSVSVFEYDILQEAKWDDGTPIQATDYSFTVKAALNPYVKNKNWKSTLKNVNEIHLDPKMPKHLKIEIQKNYLLGKEICGNVNIYPESYYDPNKIMNKYNIHDLLTKDSTAWTDVERSELKKFADDFQNAEMCKNKISGSGPYKLESWESGSKIVLQKKKDWWGAKFSKNNPMLSAFPDRIEYLIIPDEAATILGLKDGSIDLANDISPKQFDALQKDETSKIKLQFFAINGISQYTFLDLNTRKPGLSETPVRIALSQLIDAPGFIKNVMQGMANPIVGPINPSLPYYNKTLKPVAFDPQSAASELAIAGWKDSDKDGILDKIIDGKRVQLSFSLLVATETGKKLALLFQEEAKKIGVAINPEMKEFSLMQKDLNELNFDMAALVLGQSPSLYDPFQSWHSSNTKPGGSNRCGFATPETDSLIQIIRTSSSDEERYKSYLRFQEILYNERPQIFLFSPKTRLIATSRIKLVPSSRRPGYAEYMIQLADK